jgi:hypothetical protein
MMIVMPPFPTADKSDARVVAAVVRRLIISIVPIWVTEFTDQVVCQTMTVPSAPPALRSGPKPHAAAMPIAARKSSRSPELVGVG